MPAHLGLGPFPRLGVSLQRPQVWGVPRRVLRSEQSRRETQQTAQLVVHVVDEPCRSVFALRVRVRPCSVEGALDEPAGALLWLVPHVLLDLESHLVSTRQPKVVAIARALAWGTNVELLRLVEVGRPLRRVLNVLGDDSPHAFSRRFDLY